MQVTSKALVPVGFQHPTLRRVVSRAAVAWASEERATALVGDTEGLVVVLDGDGNEVGRFEIAIDRGEWGSSRRSGLRAVAVHEGHVAFGVADRVALFAWDGKGVPRHIATSEPLVDLIGELRWDGDAWLAAPLTGNAVRVTLDGAIPERVTASARREERAHAEADPAYETLREAYAIFDATCAEYEEHGAMDTEVREQLARACLDVLAAPSAAIDLPGWMLFEEAPKKALRALDKAADAFLRQLAAVARDAPETAGAFLEGELGIAVDAEGAPSEAPGADAAPSQWSLGHEELFAARPPFAIPLGERAALLVDFRDSVYVVHPEALARGVPQRPVLPPSLVLVQGSDATLVTFQDRIVDALDASTGETTRIAEDVTDLAVRPGGVLVQEERDGAQVCVHRSFDGRELGRLENATLFNGVPFRYDSTGRGTALDVDGGALLDLGKKDTLLAYDPSSGRVAVYRGRRPECAAVLAVPSGEVIASEPSEYPVAARLLERRAAFQVGAGWTILDLATGEAMQDDRRDLTNCVAAGSELFGLLVDSDGIAVTTVGAEPRVSERLDSAAHLAVGGPNDVVDLTLLLAVGGPYVAVVANEGRDAVVLLDRETLAVRAAGIPLRGRAEAIAVSRDTLAVLYDDAMVELFTLSR